jgi:2-keto-4-pentenoate hydratase/2-oxohepta-3-ene-1,7-dioic acid hydratase in catechol pathway
LKLARFSTGAPEQLGLVLGDGILPLSAVLPSAPATMIELIERWEELAPELARLDNDCALLPLESVRLLAPVRAPRKIMGIGLNYADHVSESGLGTPAEQLWFSKPPTASNGPYDPIVRPRVSRQLDYEAELVIVIGKKCRYADAKAAAGSIFGYCAGNDVSVRDWQFKTSQFILGKSFDGHAPHGPWIVTSDEIDPLNLDIACRVNGELRQSSNTSQLIYGPVDQVQYLSQVMTLEPGDLLFTGTPAGVGWARTPQSFLSPGDKVSVSISGIGEILNQVVGE